jgi:hypothetical protein
MLSTNTFVAFASSLAVALGLGIGLVACGGSSTSDGNQHDAGSIGGSAAGGAGGDSGSGGHAASGGTSATGGAGGASGSGAQAGAAGTGGEGGHVIDPNCGAPGQPCCLGNSCQSGGCCVETVCVADTQDCGDGLGACDQGSCGTCGGAGQQCCAEQQTDGCSSLGKNCGGCTQAGTTCKDYKLDGSCTVCGGDGQPCCGVGECLGEYSLCVNGTCTSTCGHAGEPCCQGAHPWPPSCRNGGCCLQTSSGPNDSVCVDSPTCGCGNGVCTTCGTLGQPCCEGQCQIDQGECNAANGAAGTCENPPPPQP